MTTDKAFKRVVRARMAKTGERYAAARRALLESGTADAPRGADGRPDSIRLPPARRPPSGDGHAGQRPRQPGCRLRPDRRPLTEAAILGIGGGLGAGYILWEFKQPRQRPSSRSGSGTSGSTRVPGWTGTTLGRLGIEPDVHETGGAEGAREALDARLDAGSPVIASVDLQSIGTWGLPEALSGHFGHAVVVVGREADGTYLVDDRGRAPFRIAPDVMAAARGRIGSYKHRIVALRTTAGPIPADRLRAAMHAGLEDQVDHLRSTSDSFSLPAWRKWARMMTDERNAKAWPRVFADGHGLFGALLAIVEAVDAQVEPVGRSPARPVRDVARRGGRRARRPGARRCRAGVAGPPTVGRAGGRGGAAGSRRLGRRGRGDRDAAGGRERRGAGRRGCVRPRRRRGRSGPATPGRSRCRRDRSTRSCAISATSSPRSTQAEVDAVEATASAIAR